MNQRVKLPVGIAYVSIVLFTIGCGINDDPRVYHVSGKITRNGELVTAGTVVFMPDSHQGNSGPQGAANIVNGAYDTAIEGMGTVGGPYQVMVTATEGEVADDAASEEVSVFRHTFERELPKDTSIQDFEMPIE
ncbi:hypothetical protein [Calycomorphotria hydatis]|uniref:Carboxypeptidase regulatory-like domain-containing protein n=1 Tax=Calycomorphotria hydatis TaxID=2528027 RepID=A0A517T9S1_9PLAN|nr:hypothetical protein [Calycomorphotria hydatis]QDT65124.1 hypothetical protein V22_23710 [Calycomorphotria hydatis]